MFWGDARPKQIELPPFQAFLWEVKRLKTWRVWSLAPPDSSSVTWRGWSDDFTPRCIKNRDLEAIFSQDRLLASTGVPYSRRHVWKHRSTCFVPIRQSWDQFFPCFWHCYQPFLGQEARTFTTGATNSAAQWWPPSCAAYPGFGVVRHSLSHGSCQAQLWGVTGEVTDDRWCIQGKCSTVFPVLLSASMLVAFVRPKGQLLFKSEALPTPCSSEVGRTCSQRLHSSTSTCCGGNQ